MNWTRALNSFWDFSFSDLFDFLKWLAEVFLACVTKIAKLYSVGIEATTSLSNRISTLAGRCWWELLPWRLFRYFESHARSLVEADRWGSVQLSLVRRSEWRALYIDWKLRVDDQLIGHFLKGVRCVKGTRDDWRSAGKHKVRSRPVLIPVPKCFESVITPLVPFFQFETLLGDFFWKEAELRLVSEIVRKKQSEYLFLVLVLICYVEKDRKHADPVMSGLELAFDPVEYEPESCQEDHACCQPRRYICGDRGPPRLCQACWGFWRSLWAGGWSEGSLQNSIVVFETRDKEWLLQ